jgi:hypothetical protein
MRAVRRRRVTYLRAMSRRTAFHDLPVHYFPFEIRIYDAEGWLLWSAQVERGPVLLDVPAFPGRVARAEMEFATGEISTVIG